MLKQIAAFGEDYAHQKVVEALIRRVSREEGVDVAIDWRSSRGGYPRVVSELSEYFRDLKKQGNLPDFVVVATDSNCKGLNRRISELPLTECPVPVVRAIPAPHIERWLLLDGAAFRVALGRGCPAPDKKCERDRYKQKLIEAIISADIVPAFGGVEFAEEIVQEMDLASIRRSDDSFDRFLAELLSALRDD
ncbi:MAG: DUF4276 family protein [Lysobacter sp.]|nr:MAG: DUF4276 family protein [Lysobacter sp.]